MLARSCLILLCLMSTGCVFQHTVRPLDINYDASQLHSDAGRGDVKRFRYSLVDLQWNSNAMGDIAKEHGIETIYYADIETLRVLGIWTQNTVHVYGE